MAYKPTKEQQAVLDIEEKNIIVSASAGSGKTSVMINKIFGLINEKKTPVTKILALSYTTASANELKQRLEATIMQEGNIFSKNQLEYLPQADMSTIHSFCQKLISKYFYVIDVDPSFTVMEEAEKEKLQNMAYDNASNIIEEKKYYELMEIFSNRSEDNLKKIIFDLSTFCESLTEENWQEKALNLFNTSDAEDFLFNTAKAKINYFNKDLKAMQKDCQEKGFAKYIKYFNNILSQTEPLEKLTSLVEICEALKNINYGVLTKDNEDKEDYQEILSNQMKNQKTKLQTIKDKDYGDKEKIKKSYENCKTIAANIFELKTNYENEYKTLKQRRNYLDFSDLEKNAEKLLDNEFVCGQVKKQYDYVFIDEFQDANNVQEKLISKICRENNRFMVGDVKQSIYEFRQSNPEIFLNKQKEYQQSTQSESKSLKSNFRSDKDILSFVNDIFSSIMTELSSGIDYANTSKFNAELEFQDDGNKKVQINLITTDNIEKPDAKGLYSVQNHIFETDDNSNAKKEAYVIASQIIALKNSLIYDKDQKCLRKVNYEDMVILLRNRGNYQNVLTKVLTSVGIPVEKSTNENILDTIEGRLLQNLLTLVSNKKNDIALFNIMVSELFNFSEEELSQIKLNYPDEKYFWQATETYKEEKQDDLKQKLKEFYEDIKNLKENIEFFGIKKALTKFYEEKKLIIKYTSYPNSTSKICHLKTFADMFEDEKISLDEFVHHKISVLTNEVTENSCVKIMTMHASKGLEFPIVFLANLSQNFTRFNGQKTLMFNKNIGIATKNYDVEFHTKNDSIFYDYISQKNKQKEFAEKIRLLYVAMTRAKNHLVIVGEKPKFISKIKTENDITEKTNYADLVLSALCQNQIDKINNNQSFTFGENNNFEINIIKDKINENILKPENQIIIQKQTEESKNLKDYLTQNMKTPASEISFKNSVSSLLESDNYASYNTSPNLLDVKEHLKGNSAEEGILYHKILELIDFNNVSSLEDLRRQMDKNINDNALPKDVYYTFDINEIYKNILLLNNIIGESKTLKEQKFMMKIPYNKTNESDIKNDILVQGIIDLFIEDKNIIIDYKFTNTESEFALKKRYQKQVELYATAIEKALGIKVQKKYILNLKKNMLIKL